MSTPAEPTRIELEQDKPVAIGGGVKITLKTGLEAHLSGSQNRLLMRLVATRDGVSQDVQLERLYPHPPSYVTVLGRRLAVDSIDAYHQPTTGAILVLPE